MAKRRAFGVSGSYRRCIRRLPSFRRDHCQPNPLGDPSRALPDRAHEDAYGDRQRDTGSDTGSDTWAFSDKHAALGNGHAEGHSHPAPGCARSRCLRPQPPVRRV